MRDFIHDDFLLSNDTARELFHGVAARQPIIDYHCHLPPDAIARNHAFSDLSEIWLAGDHYKWRAMRANGIAERFCTGDAAPVEKFAAWAATVPMTLRNPLYHWTHLELKRYFGIADLLNSNTAPSVWESANEQLRRPDMRVWGLLEKMRVEVVCTTDDPTDSLDAHRTIAASDCPTRVFPAFRPDRATQLSDLVAWNDWCDRLAEVSGHSTDDYAGFLMALQQRHDFFHSMGGRLSDHGIDSCPSRIASPDEAQATFHRARTRREPITPSDAQAFAGAILVFTGHLDHDRGWTKQLHLGALRNTNSRMLGQLGRDTGFDSIGDQPQAESLRLLLDTLDQDGRLPQVILYNLNPADNYVIGTMIGNFQDGTRAGKIQFGSGWWFLDQKEAMEWQMNALSNLGLLSRFVGMLTDSRSFLSYPRHEYFRRVLCNLLGADAEAGLIPNDPALLGDYVERICHRNASEFFRFPVAEKKESGSGDPGSCP